MSIRLTGVVRDGTDQGADVQTNDRKTIELTRGSDARIDLDVVRPDGSAVDLTGATTTLIIKERPNTTTATATISSGGIVDLRRGKLFLTVAGSTWLRILSGRYFYEISTVLVDTTEYVIVPASPLILNNTLRAGYIQ